MHRTITHRSNLNTMDILDQFNEEEYEYEYERELAASFRAARLEMFESVQEDMAPPTAADAREMTRAMTLMSTNAARDTIMHTIEKPSVQQDLGMPAEGALAWDPVDKSWRINGSKTQILREIQVRPSAERSEPRAHRVIDIQSLQARTTSQYESAGHSPDTLPDTPIGMRTFDTRDIPDEELAAVYTAEAGRPSRGNRRSGHWQGNPLYSSHTVQQRQGQQQMQDDPESPYRPPLRPPTPDGMYRIYDSSGPEAAWVQYTSSGVYVTNSHESTNSAILQSAS